VTHRIGDETFTVYRVFMTCFQQSQITQSMETAHRSAMTCQACQKRQ